MALMDTLKWQELGYNFPDLTRSAITRRNEAKEAEVVWSGCRIEENAVTWVEHVRH
jgi:hypothetical protein